MTTHLLLIQLILTVIIPRSTLGATYKMIQVPGYPDPATSYPTDILEEFPFEDCVQKCFLDDYCVMVYWSNNNICLYYLGGDVLKVRNDAELSASEEKVAFKISATSCTATAPEILDGVSTPYQYSSITAYKISVASDFYTIQYTYTNMDACGNWYIPTPQCSVCKHTMFSFRGTAWAGENDVSSSEQVKSWMDCLSLCHSSDDCFIARMRETGTCYLFNYGIPTGILIFDPTTMSSSSETLVYIAMKLTTSVSHPSFGVGPKDGNSSFTWTEKEGCGDSDAIVYPNVPGCYKIKIVGDGVNRELMKYSEAIHQCYSIGGDGLMTMPDGNAMTEFYNHLSAEAQAGIRYFFIGLFRTDLTQPFGWMLPELKIAEFDIPWTDGVDYSECGAGYLYYWGPTVKNVQAIK
ncbi:hypothetical protein CAEBREN_20820 [Caenorhabditis brenneri]|uniref:PAN-3 domain-containing protein n=1 Tax=Caenorhabditis brenneri TaxID=135651 RepID=G0NWB2_CAEBE|nr:hypothetical protein CAEBREN_20820 [Caenorhabditis brenneri]